MLIRTLSTLECTKLLAANGRRRAGQNPPNVDAVTEQQRDPRPDEAERRPDEPAEDRNHSQVLRQEHGKIWLSRWKNTSITIAVGDKARQAPRMIDTVGELPARAAMPRRPTIAGDWSLKWFGSGTPAMDYSGA